MDRDKTNQSPLLARSRDSHVSSRAHDSMSMRTMLQEEFVPAHGSIYFRSISPGPGYYGIPAAGLQDQKQRGHIFRSRPQGRIDEVEASSRKNPGPAEYTPRKHPSMTETAPLGSFGRAVKSVSPLEVSKKLPFVSSAAARVENHSLFSPNDFYAVTPEAVSSMKGFSKQPKYSFGKSRRPF